MTSSVERHVEKGQLFNTSQGFAIYVGSKLREIADSGTWKEFKKIPKEDLPKHVGVILDGNSRWAESRRLKRALGHQMGSESVKEIARTFMTMGMNTTLWAFSTDNWIRSEEERNSLFQLINDQVTKTLPEIEKNGGRLIHLGRKKALVDPSGKILIPCIPNYLIETLKHAEDATKDNTGPIVALAINYSGLDEINRIRERMKEAGMDNVSLTHDLCLKFGDDGGKLGKMDLLIRTAGDQRTSGFGWRAEHVRKLYFPKKQLPALRPSDVARIIIDWTRAEERNGGRPNEIPTLSEFKARFDRVLEDILNKKIEVSQQITTDSSIKNYLDYTKKIVLNGGKRIRPYFGYLMYKALGGEEDEKAIKFLASLELFHTSVLIHDDIIDKEQKRHDVDTLHQFIFKKEMEGKDGKQNTVSDKEHFAISQSIVIGDLYLIWAREVMDEAGFSSDKAEKARALFYEMAHRTALGQMLDLNISFGKTTPQKDALRVMLLKTADYTITKPMQIGATLAGADKSVLDFCKKFGVNLGIAYQAIDDLQDKIDFDQSEKANLKRIISGRIKIAETLLAASNIPNMFKQKVQDVIDILQKTN